MTAPSLSVVVHGHFYQPPREDPWTGEVPRQPSAAPFHDWNQRIERECYGPVTHAALLDGGGSVRGRMNALKHMSFDFGPTLLAWLEPNAPETYSKILLADRDSCERLDGSGNAMAMAFHHAILPLADPRDRRTEVRWGIADFQRRFQRKPEGMWLPETAVDSDTLATLAGAGIRFTVLAPHQVERVPAGGLPGRVTTPEGEVAVFVYDGALSHAVAFGDLVRDGAAWAETMAKRPVTSETAENPLAGGWLRSVCTDGETYGHHHRFADMGLAAMLDHLLQREDVRVENFASFLRAHPPVEEITLVEPSAWSCAHGVDRWQSACGCKSEPDLPTSQAWRAPLREALAWLATELHGVFEAEAAGLLTDPWSARDAYGAVRSVNAFLDGRTLGGLGGAERSRALQLLEMERDALRFFTSCAWFFDDVARVEPRQALRYAAHAVELAGPAARDIENGFIDRLRLARANNDRDGTAADLYLAIARRGDEQGVR